MKEIERDIQEWDCSWCDFLENKTDDLVIEENTIYEIDQKCYESLCHERCNKNRGNS